MHGFLRCAILLTALFLAAAPAAMAEADLPFVFGAGGGAVLDVKNGVGWSVRLDGSGHPGKLSWLQLGLEIQYFARPEKRTLHEKKTISGGVEETERWTSDGGFMAGPVLHVPFGFGGLEKIPEHRENGMSDGRRQFDVAPMLSGGILIDGTNWRKTVTKDRPPEEKVSRSDSQGGGKIQGAYMQAGGRFRWTLLETGLGIQLLTRRPLQGVAWLGFNVPW